MNLRKIAKGKPCMVRIPSVCDGGGETTVLAHYRLAGYCGTGKKPGDLLGAWCCAKCHDYCDGRVPWLNYTRAEVRWMHAEGVLRTLAQLERDGAVSA